MNRTGVIAAAAAATILGIVINLSLLAGAIWVVVKVLKLMGVL